LSYSVTFSYDCFNVAKCLALADPTSPQTGTLMIPADSIRTTTLAALDATYETADAAERALALISEALGA
jgi:hypothetical protein